MKLIERINKDKETLKTLKTKKDKLIFIWDYYKIPIFSIISAIIIGIFIILKSVTANSKILSVVLINSDSQIVEVDDSVFTDVLEKAGVDVDNKVVDINDYLTLGLDNNEQNDIETLQVLNALFSFSDLDIFVGFKDDFDRFTELNAFYDLSTLIDQNLLEANEANAYKYYDQNGQEVVGGIILHENSPLHKAHYYHNDVIIGVTSNPTNIEYAKAFITQLLMD